MLNLKHLLDNMKQTLGGSWPPTLDPLSVLNQAGEHLYSMHAWKFAQGRSTLLNLRGTVSGTAATFDGTSTLTDAGAFTDYTFVEGDEIQITGGTGVTEGFYEITARASANALTIPDIGAVASDVAYTIQPYSIDLPDDCRDIIAIQGTGASNWNHVTMTTLAEVLRVREVLSINDAHWYAAISYAGSPPTPILEIAPGSGSNQVGALRMFYRSRWARLSDDAGAVDVPEYIETLLLQIARAFARGYVREDVSSLDERLAVIHAGPVFFAAKKSDGAIQPYRMTQGGIERWRVPSEIGDWHETTSRISGPT
jgi:hypothetical protein